MPSSLVFARARGYGAEGYVDTPRDVAPGPPQAHTCSLLPDPLASRATEQSIEAIREQPEGGERGAENDNLRPCSAPGRVDELRQEGQEKQRDLRVEDLHEHALRKDVESVLSAS